MALSASPAQPSGSSVYLSGFFLGEGVDGRAVSVSDAFAALVARLGPRRPDVTVNGEPWDGSDVHPDDYPDSDYYGAGDGDGDDQ